MTTVSDVQHTTWMTFTKVMLNEKNQTPEYIIYCMIPFIHCIKRKKKKLIYATTRSQDSSYPQWQGGG